MSRADRRNTNKPKLSMVDLTCLESCAEVLEFGAKKYVRDDWRKGMPMTEIIDSLLRHLGALQRGELIDPESGLSHIGHVQCNALFLGNKANEDDLPINIGDELPKVRNQSDDWVSAAELLQNIEDDNAAMSIKDSSDNIDMGKWKLIGGDWFPAFEGEPIGFGKDEPVSFEEYDAWVYANRPSRFDVDNAFNKSKKNCPNNTCMDCDVFKDGASNNKKPFTPLCCGNKYSPIDDSYCEGYEHD